MAAQQVVYNVVDELKTIEPVAIMNYLDTNMDLVADEDLIVRLLSPTICQIESNLLYKSYGYENSTID